MKTFEYEIIANEWEDKEATQANVIKWYNKLGINGWEIVHIRETVSQNPFVVCQFVTVKKQRWQ